MTKQNLLRLELNAIRAKHSPRQYYLQSQGRFAEAFEVLMNNLREQWEVIQEHAHD